MNLIIDAGNTYVKLAIFDRGLLKEKNVVDYNESNVVLTEVLDTYPNLDKAIVSSVGKYDAEVLKQAKPNLHIIELSHELTFPFKNKYATPKTLGVDRIALVCAAVEQYANKNVLIIDAGTCITYDFVNVENEYLGGAISPGIRLRYKSLNDFTANLPLLHTEMPELITGNSTQQSIHSGVVYGVIKEIDGVIEEYADNYSDLTVILTGGDAKFLSKQLKNSIFANSNFLLEGLNFILEYNTHL
ncbi:type III pantothenate kinase [Psychroserpens sp.]|uniref:type III pantothenate kinase n=1 Tax=Psychroserpens sp. TaxID=2020870 RepID=UPI001B062D6A|nr:type III pantothenate kinase [Psychroserpens sp.]MBO6605829.1 type III pantothenate kinase [Psychroserpens sp.]MBO6630466.1 type III pantothenate kinase [Psychroserpens sp.]MBO6652800.1 type III pantothenate kinase [Psychroserpens sp.]MBO6681428.1 type III pantothenate kinase [Psychroserpens sp.]MBO6749203.1 type III pantothenate kinase [Psychroserpens sp.]